MAAPVGGHRADPATKLRGIMSRLQRLFANLGKSGKQSDLSDELRFHLEKEVELNVARGMSHDEARRQALISFGGVQQARENVSRVRWTHCLEVLAQDLRYAVRTFRKSPFFTSITIAILAIGIGANTATFSIVNAVLLKMLPVKEPEKLVALSYWDARGHRETSFSYPHFDAFSDRNQVFSGIFATSFNALDIKFTGPGASGKTERAKIGLVSGTYFPILGVNAVMGRTLTADDDRPGAPNPVAVISYGYWQRRLAQDPAVIGKTLDIGDTVFTIVGVTPRGFFGETVGRNPDIWVPITMEDRLTGESYLNTAETSWLEIMGRLKPGVTPKQAAASMDILFQETTGELMGPKAGSICYQTEVTPASKGLEMLRQRFARPLQVLMSVVGLVLLIACISVASLLMARASSRQREIAVRVTLGASTRRLIQQLMTESVLLAIMGGTLGLLLAWWAERLLPILLFRNAFSMELQLSSRVLGFTLLVSLVTGILFGLAPALGVLRPNLAYSLKKEEHVGTEIGNRFGFRKVFVVGQVALSLLLLITAGLFVRSLQKLYDAELGFNKENLLLVQLQPGADAPASRLKIACQQLLDRVNTLPGVKSSSLSMGSFADAEMTMGPMVIEGYTPKPGEDRTMGADIASPGFFKTMGIPLIAGRDFRPQDNTSTTRVAIVNESFVRHYFGNASPLGKHFAFNRLNRQPMEIIGIVKDAKHGSLKEQARPFYYKAFLQQDQEAEFVRMLEIRTVANPVAVAATVRSTVDSIDGVLKAQDITTMTVQVENTLQQEQMLARVSGAFGAFALLLACIGLYGMMAHSVTCRTSEIGIRMALGAERFDVLWMVLRETLLLVLAGVTVGVPVAFAGARLALSLVSGLLFGLKAYDPLTMLIAALVMTVVGVLAGYLPARRAANVDPIVAIRYE